MISGGARVEAAELGGGEYYSEKLPDVGGAPDTPGVPCSELNQVKKAVLTRTTFKRELDKLGHFFLLFYLSSAVVVTLLDSLPFITASASATIDSHNSWQESCGANALHARLAVAIELHQLSSFSF